VEFGIKDCCEALEVSRSGYYQRQKGELGPRAQANQLLARLYPIFKGRRGSKLGGSPTKVTLIYVYSTRGG
jgi:hypothetical protein